MATGSFVALSGQLALDARLSTIAHNIANARTAGFKAGGVHFNPLQSNTSDFSTVFASAGKAHVNLASGAITRTGNPLDVAVQGQGYLAYSSPTGTYYSRDGRLTMLESGEVVNVLGHPLLDAGQAPVTLNSKGGVVSISKDGGIYQDNIRVSQIGLFQVDLSAGFARTEGSGVVPVNEAEPVTTLGENGIASGFIEESNVNPVNEMVKLIQVTRAFEAASSSADRMLESELEAIKSLGAR